MTARRILGSPLVHFFAVGGLIFALNAWLADPAPEVPDPDRLVLTAADAARLAERFERTWGRPATEAELEGLMRDWAVEEAMVREALALGLDRGDEMIRNRLRHKVSFLAEAPAASAEPDDATLAAFVEAHPERYASPGWIGFAQASLPPDAGPAETAQVLARLEAGTDPADFGGARLLPTEVERMPAPVVERVFGEGFVEALAELPPGRWSGPVRSAYGLHLVRLDGRGAAAPRPLEEVRERALADWRAQEARRARDAFAEALLGRYTLDLPAAAEVLDR
ncbi:peptidylprolyl isomerase [Albimonas sp. CAU 1670]|uniref:peptidylprolyl isomerase n=1 Tax=Albimonas sp. CAU 1670 TaxID=3032599 RepID=UPI0023DCCCE4|nr:peptidylprolyl isomerase [Albimonas sp. CAU 1670]MDF2231263.1 peptidylprolyl isomerase [Albimonas sp. CAU 1670]